jgi:hypothetical protein
MNEETEETREGIGATEWTYDHIRPFLMTGDQVLFKGKGLISGIICLLTGGDKSHIGTIVRAEGGIVMLLESDWGKNIHGLQMTLFGEKVRTYKGEIYVRFLNCRRTPEWYETLYKYVERNRGTSYGFGKKELFCSKTSAGLFINWRYLPSHIPAAEYTPEDFDEGKKVDDYLRETSVLLSYGGAKLSPCQKIVKG